MKKFSVFMLALSIAIGLSSCGSSSTEASDTEKPMITIEQPSVNQQIKAGDEFSIKVIVTDNKELKNWKYDIALTTKAPEKKNNDTWEVIGTMQPLSGASFTKTTPQLTTATAILGIYTLTVTADDTAGNVATATRTFSLTK
ncbi:MAG: hypothetical protein RIS47_1045 [Bacteroidota bacterium]